MKPPICELCDERFDPDDGALLVFADDAATAAHDERAEQPGFVGHRPNHGWFCGDHVDAARRLVAVSLPEAVNTLRGTSTPADPEPEPTADAAPVIESRSVDQHPVEPTRPTVSERRRRRAEAERDLVEVDFRARIDVFALHERLRSFRPVLMAALGFPGKVEMVTQVRRTWHPMDGAREPHCPYTDRSTDAAAFGRIELGIELEANWWSPDALSNASARLYVLDRPAPGEWATHLCRITGTTGHLAGGAPRMVDGLAVLHPDDPAVASCIAEFASGLLATPPAS